MTCIRQKLFTEIYLEFLFVKSRIWGLRFYWKGGNQPFIYPKPDHQPATFTVLNFVVEGIDTTIERLETKGISFIHYKSDDLPQDEKGVLRGLKEGMGPDIAWFEDPAGNVLSILQEV